MKYLNRTVDEDSPDLYDGTMQEDSISGGEGHGVEHEVVANSPEPA